MKKFNINSDSIKIGKSVSYLSVLKKAHPALFRFCAFYSKKSLAEGYFKLANYYLSLKQDVYNISLHFENTHQFCIWLTENNIYKTKGSATSIGFIYCQTDMIRLDCIYKLKAIKKLWSIQND